MRHGIERTPSVGNELLGAGVAAGIVTAVLTLGLAAGIGRLVAWIGRQRLAGRAPQRCRAIEQFTREMTGSFDRLATKLDLLEPGVTVALAVGLDGLRERNMRFLEESFRAFVLCRRRTHPEEIQRAIAECLVEPLRVALDATRRVVGRRFYEGRRAADRRRLNECIRRAEIDLVEHSFRFLDVNVARPGERRFGRWKWQGNQRGLALAMLAILAFPIGCVPGWNSKVLTPERVQVGTERKKHDSESTTRRIAPASQWRNFYDPRGRRHVRARQTRGLGPPAPQGRP